MKSTLTLGGIVAALALTVTACGTGPQAQIDYNSTTPVGTPVPAGQPANPTAAPALPVVDLTALDKTDPVAALGQRAAELMTVVSVLGPGRDTAEDLTGPVRPLLTPAALARYVAALAPREEDGATGDGSPAQLMPTWVTTPADMLSPVEDKRLLDGPLTVQITSRVANPDGSVTLYEHARQAVRYLAVQPGWIGLPVGAEAVVTSNKDLVLRVVPSSSPGAWLIDSWAGTRTTTSAPVRSIP